MAKTNNVSLASLISSQGKSTVKPAPKKRTNTVIPAGEVTMTFTSYKDESWVNPVTGKREHYKRISFTIDGVEHDCSINRFESDEIEVRTIIPAAIDAGHTVTAKVIVSVLHKRITGVPYNVFQVIG